jgi:SAM-dependent methyltransferase
VKPDAKRTMRAFWDEKARENATYYISSYRPYDAQDEAEFWKWGGILVERLLAESGIAFRGDERALEIGCGIGRLTRPLARRFRAVDALDVSDEMVRRGRDALADCANVAWHVGNGADLREFADGAFDFVFSYLVLQHLPEPVLVHGYLREIGRVLAPGGWCHVQVNGEPEPAAAGGAARVLENARRALARVRAALTPPRGPGPRGLESPAWRGCRVTLPDARATLEAAGLDLRATRGEGTQYLWLTAQRRGG